MKKLLLLTIVISLCAWAIPVTETRTLSGYVFSGSGNLPIEGVRVEIPGTGIITYSDKAGYYTLKIENHHSGIHFSHPGYVDQEVSIGSRTQINVTLVPVKTGTKTEIAEITDEQDKRKVMPGMPSRETMLAQPAYISGYAQDQEMIEWNTEDYSPIDENIFHDPSRKPLSTFSIDVDAASYSNVRRFISSSQLPSKDAVRIEEMINYFSYDYAQPSGDEPFSINTEAGLCPWDKNHYLVHIGLQGRIIPTENLPPSNLVFLIDVSGSMNTANKLPLLKSAFKLLIEELRAEDKVSIVVYAGAAGLVLSPTPGDQKSNIMGSLENLQAGGSTAGGQGIKLAYQTARDHFIKGGNNRLILATDGDFNVGISSNAGMEELIEGERKSGVFLTVLGFGMGNYKDSKMEILADKGNGNYAYIDNILEAKKVFVNEFGGTLFTIAKDVKIQVEFNPAFVQSYRLVGYENRKLRDEDFNDDKKDAGELGSGHTVTALYEIIPVGVDNKYQGNIDPLKYQEQKTENRGHFRGEMMTVKLRYKLPEEDQSKLTMEIIKNNITDFEKTSDNFRFSASVAAYGMILRDSEFKGSADYDQVIEWAVNSKGRDVEGYRAELIRLVESTKLLSSL
ncbi:MAG: von Willebrand factor type A domain-containing protein [Cyclobacteriaceae bacterium]|nr:von Willebrand factor type A domain-containing protein [Cyclobacteriaceae bacterium]